MSTLDIVEAKENELKTTLYPRMDKDASLVHLDPFIMTRLDKPDTKVDNVVNVTLNAAGILGNSIVAVLLKATMQTVIQGMKNNRPMTDKETSLIEQFLEGNYEQIDDMLIRQNRAVLRAWLANHFVVRGWTGACYFPYLENGEYYSDLIPWDMRYGSWEYGRKELNWAAYRTQRSPSSVNFEYGRPEVQDREKGWVGEVGYLAHGEDLIDVVTYLDAEKQDIYIGGSHVKSMKHNWGRVPVIIQATPSGFMLRDKGYMSHEGESIFQFNRDLFGEQNRNASIEQTLGMKSILPPYTEELDNPGQGESALYPDKIATITEVPKGSTPKLVEQRDLNNAAIQGHIDINAAIGEGGLNSVDKGDVRMPSSAVAIAALQEIRSKLQEPFLMSLQMFHQQLSEMSIDFYKQLHAKNEGIRVGNKGNRRAYSASVFDGDYSIRYRFMTQDKQQEIANIAVYQATKGELPLEVRVRDILKASNPQELIDKINSEKAEIAEPAIALVRIAHSLVDEADKLDGEAENQKLLESQMLTRRAVLMLQGLYQPTGEPKETGNSALLMPLLGQGGMGKEVGLPKGGQGGR